MSSFFFWLLIVLCVVALVILFFPFKFKIEFEAGEHGAWAHFFFFKKNFWNCEKKWGKESSEAGDAGESDSVEKDDEPDDDCMPSFVATAPKPKVEAKPATPAKPAEVKPVEKPAEIKPAETPAAVKPAAIEEAKPASNSEPAKKEKPEKRKLTDTEFWTILLTPDLDGRAFRYVKRVLAALLKLFRLKFVDCFVEGIRSDYKTMGYGAAANGIFKSFPVLCDWELRMDWCGDKQLRAVGTLLGTVNLCRLLGLILLLLFYAGILLFLFWRRRARVLKTGELPQLGFVRKKIIGWIVEE